MSVRVKSRRRLVWLLSITLLVVGGGATIYLVRMHQLEMRARKAHEDGLAALAEGRYYDALQGIGTYVQRHPNDPQALYDYGQAREHVDEPNGRNLMEATTFYNRALSLRPGDLKICRSLIDLYLRMGFNTEAISNADQVLAQAPQDKDALRARAIALYRMRKFDDCLAAAELHNKLDPTNLQVQLITLDLLHRKGRTPQQLADYVTKLRVSLHDDPRLQVLQAVACRALGDQTQSLQWLRKAAESKVSDPNFVQTLVSELDLAEQFDDALKVLQRSVGSTGDVALRRALVSRLLQMDRGSEVIQRLASVDPALPSSDSDLLGMRAMALLSAGRHEEAASIAHALASRQGDGTAAAWAAVLPAIDTGGGLNDRQIIDACNKALQTAPANAFFRNILGQVYSRTGESESAVAQWQRASGEAPAWVTPLLEAAQVLDGLGRPRQALELAQAARRRAPQAIEPMVAVVLAGDPLVQSVSTPAALKSAQDLLQLVNTVQQQQPQEPRTLPVQIRLMALTGDRAGAIARLKSALDAPKAPAEAVLLKLAAISQQAQLGLDSNCFARSQQAHGLTADLAFAKAKWSFDSGQAAEGVKSLEADRHAPHTGKEVDWQLAWARYLDLAQDPRAAVAWRQLGDQFPADTHLQWMVLGARALQPDHEFLGRTIDRLRAVLGDDGLNLKLVRAQWMLQGPVDQQQTVQASTLLNEISRSAPDLLAPRLLLAACLERLGNISGAVDQLTTAANLRPDANGISLELARMLQSQGDFEQASTYLDRAVQSNLLTPVERRQAAQLLLQQGQPDRALAVLKGAGGLPNSSPDLLQASIYRELHQNDKADAVFHKLLLDKPDAKTIAAAVDLYLATGQKDQAAQAVAKLDAAQAAPGEKELIWANYERHLGRPAAAAGHYLAATRQAPQNQVPWLQLVSFYVDEGQLDPALSAALAGLKAVPACAELKTFVGQKALLAALVGDPAARPLITTLLQPSASSGSQDLIQALQALNDGKQGGLPAGQVLARIRPIADRQPKLLVLQEFMIRSYAGVGQLDDAVTIATRTMQLFPTNPEPARLAAVSLAAAGRWSEAEPVAEKWRARAPEQAAEADRIIASAYVAQQQPQQAMEILKPYIPGITAKPDEPLNLSLLTVYCEAQLGAAPPQQTAMLLQPLLKSSSGVRALWVSLAASVIRSSDTATEWLKQIESAASPSFDDAVLLARGWQALAKRQPGLQAEASKAIARAELLSKSAEHPSVASLFVLGSLEENVANLPAAEVIYRRALAVDPKQPVILNNLAMVILHRHEHLDEAATMAEAAIQANPQIPNFYDTLATIEVEQKRYPQALANMKKALSLRPSELLYQVNLAAILAQSGQRDKAKALLGKIEDSDTDAPRVNPEVKQKLEQLRSALAKV